MKLYGISGLGADHRVFSYLTLDYNLEIINWDQNYKGTSLKEYANILCSQMNTTKPFGIIAVSFGGVLAIEISHILKPSFIILISSMRSPEQLNPIFRIVGKTRLLKLLPSRLFKPPRLLATYFFGAVNYKLLYKILADTDLKFAKWAILNLLEWKGVNINCRVIQIHGSIDKLIKPPRTDSFHVINGGGHFMIVDRANEISDIVNDQIKRL